MASPQQSSDIPTATEFQRTRRCWWWPLLAGVAVTPVAIFLAVLSHGFGHGDGSGDDFLFPLHRPLRVALHSAIAAEYIIYFSQYALYGVFLALANRRRCLLSAGLGLIGLHVACYLVRDMIADLLFRIGF